MDKVNTIVKRKSTATIPTSVIEGFSTIAVGDIGHLRQVGFMDTAIRPVWPNVRLVGPATTVRMPVSGASLTREAIRQASPGDVIVIDRCGQSDVACWGGFVALLAKVKGIAGLIVDGAVTDTMEIAALGWPVYSRSVSGVLGHDVGDGYGEINTTANCGGVPVDAGDLIVADDDGIVVVRPWEAATLLDQCRERFNGKPDIRKWLREGRPLEDYPGVQEFLSSSEGA